MYFYQTTEALQLNSNNNLEKPQRKRISKIIKTCYYGDKSQLKNRSIQFQHSQAYIPLEFVSVLEQNC